MPAADHGHEVRHAPAVDVEHRDHMEDHVVLVVAERELGVERMQVQRALAQRDALGQARGAARVEQLGDRVLVHLGMTGLGRAARQQRLVLVSRHATRLALEHHEPRARRELWGDRLDQRGEVAVEEHDLRARVIEDVRDLVGRQPDVDGVEDGTGLEHAEVGLEEVVGVVGDERHPVAGRHAEADERVGQPVRPLGPRVVGQRGLAVDDADLVTEVGGRPVAKLEDRKGHEHGKPPRSRRDACVTASLAHPPVARYVPATIRSAVRRASAISDSIGLTPDAVGIALASVTYRPRTP